MIAWGAVVLAGGRASRLGGIDKTALVAGSRTLLEHALEATRGARSVVVVGETAPPGVLHVVEEPRYGGPVAALAAGLRAAPGAPFTAVLAADLPRVDEALPLLLAAVDEGDRADAWVAADPAGRLQFLLGLYRTAALEEALLRLTSEGDLAGASMRALIAPLTILPVPLPDELCHDVDTPEDARRDGIDVPAPRGVLR